MTRPLTPEREAEIHAALSKYGQHPSIGFACCSAHDAADAATDLLAELEWVRRAYVFDTAELKRRVAAVEAATRAEIAADFEQFGKRKDFLTWGEAVLIVREGLCKCRGGSKPCETAVTS